MAQVLSLNTKTKLNDGASNAQTEFVNPTESEIPFGVVELEKFMTQNQTTNQWQYVPVAYDGGKFNFTMQYNSTDYARLVAVRGLKFITGTTPVTFQVVTSDATPVTYSIPAIVETVKTDAPQPNKIMMTKVTCQISGPITSA